MDALASEMRQELHAMRHDTAAARRELACLRRDVDALSFRMRLQVDVVRCSAGRDAERAGWGATRDAEHARWSATRTAESARWSTLGGINAWPLIIAYLAFYALALCLIVALAAG